MSIGKFLAGTTLAAPAIGGGGYITYRELTKETTNEESAERPATKAPGAAEERSQARGDSGTVTTGGPAAAK